MASILFCMEYLVGCSGWSYKHWKNIFYPEGLAQTKWLQFYSQTFDTVEINTTFYHFPKASTFEKWYKESPENFKFTLKGSRVVTHYKKLLSVEEPLKLFYQNAEILKDKIGAVLWQFPPALKMDVGRLEGFLKLLPKEYENTIEFRNKGWFVPEVYKILKKYNVALCAVSAPVVDFVVEKTTNFAYFRLHGKNVWYDYNYSERELKKLVEDVKQVGVKAYVYFDNDPHAYAINNAISVKNQLNS